MHFIFNPQFVPHHLPLSALTMEGEKCLFKKQNIALACYRIFIVISWIVLGNSFLTDFQRVQLYKFSNLFTSRRSSQERRLYLLCLWDLGFPSGRRRPREIMWPAWAHTGSAVPGTSFKWRCQNLPGTRFAEETSRSTFWLFFKNKFSLPENIILQLEE